MRAVALLGLVGAILWLERRRPLRRRVDPGPRRLARNFAIAALTAAAVAVVERPLISRLAEETAKRRWGLVPRLGLPPRVQAALVLALMDYTLYCWHILLHRVPLLWRCHRAHHADLDLDASTAARFHFAEFMLSVPWRAAQVVLIGVSPRLLDLWAKLTLAEVVFHHSNLRLPLALERLLSRLIMTPRLHGIHHSTVREERDSNFSSGLTVWDLVHGTCRADVPQASIVIGLPEYQEPQKATLGTYFGFRCSHTSLPEEAKVKRPHAVALDIVETVFALEPLSGRLRTAGLPESALRLFFAQMLRDAFALEASGAYKPFKEVAAGSLAVLMANHGVPADKASIQSVLAGFAELPPHPDVGQALERLRSAGIRIIALTNGGAENTQKLLDRANLASFVEKTISIDEVRRWKPNREVYLHAARGISVEPGRLVLVAAHAWDVHGAKQAGLCGAWVRRQDKAYHSAMQPPDVQGDSLLEVADALIALPA
jgi:2-haloalkanoic acid dehalogenase type II